MPIPGKSEAPSLAGLTPAFPRLVFNIGLAGGGPQDRKGRLHVVNFVRTADLAAAEQKKGTSGSRGVSWQ